MFWILYFQMFDTVLWYMSVFIDGTALNNFVNGIVDIGWKFDVEHVTVINALTIVVLQLFVSKIVSKTKALPTMITGVAIGIIGMSCLAISTNIWVFMAGIVIFSIGEMTAHPKYISYLGLIAPPDKKATYMGFGFLYGALSSFIGPIVGAALYVRLIDNPMIAYMKNKVAATGSSLPTDGRISDMISHSEGVGLAKADILAQAHTSELWLIFSGIGIVCIVSLLLYQKFLAPKGEH
jgi:proton-dependent oligopeptide transporter, POT family